MNLNTKQEGLKIISAELENFQSLKHKLVEVQGKSIVVIGKNGGSKSALLRAIQSPLNSKVVPQKAIKAGQESAYVKIKLKGIVPGDADEKEFEYKIEFNEKNQKGIITVTDEEGKEVKKKSIQKDIIGDISFDVDEFIRLGMTNSGQKSVAGIREQVEILRQFLKKEEKSKLNDLDAEKKKVYDNRTDVNREISTLEAKIKGFNKFSEEDIKLINEDKSEKIKELQDNLSNISEDAVKYSKATSMKKTLEDNSVDISEQIKSLTLKIEELNKNKKDIDGKLEKINNWLEKNEEPKTEEIRKELSLLSEYQEKYKEIQGFQNMFAEKEKKAKESKKLSDRLKKIEAEKKEVFTNSTMPVKGLTFDEDGIYFNELPFDGDHHPSSHIIGIGVKLAMAMNPNLRCVFIKDGSLLDKKTFATVLKMIEKEGYQLFIEMVDWNAGDELDVEYAEEFVK